MKENAERTEELLDWLVAQLNAISASIATGNHFDPLPIDIARVESLEAAIRLYREAVAISGDVSPNLSALIHNPPNTPSCIGWVSPVTMSEAMTNMFYPFENLKINEAILLLMVYFEWLEEKKILDATTIRKFLSDNFGLMTTNINGMLNAECEKGNILKIQEDPLQFTLTDQGRIYTAQNLWNPQVKDADDKYYIPPDQCVKMKNFFDFPRIQIEKNITLGDYFLIALYYMQEYDNEKDLTPTNIGNFMREKFGKKMTNPCSQADHLASDSSKRGGPSLCFLENSQHKICKLTETGKQYLARELWNSAVIDPAYKIKLPSP